MTMDRYSMDDFTGYKILGRAKLAAASDTISVTGIPAGIVDFLIIIRLLASASIQGALRFNGDSGNNYVYARSANGVDDGAASGSAALIVFCAAASQDEYIVARVCNTLASEKLVLSECIRPGTAGAGNAPARDELRGKWANTTAEITQVDVINNSTGDFAAGSEVIVLGIR